MTEYNKTAISEAVSNGASNELATMVLNVGCETEQVAVVGTQKALQAFRCDADRDCDTISRNSALIDGLENLSTHVVEFAEDALQHDPALLKKACRFTNGDLAIAHVKDLCLDLFGSLTDDFLVDEAVKLLETYHKEQSLLDTRYHDTRRGALCWCVKSIVRLVAHIEAQGSRYDRIESGLLEFTYYSALDTCTDVEALSGGEVARLIFEYRDAARAEIAREIKEAETEAAEDEAVDVSINIEAKYHDTHAFAFNSGKVTALLTNLREQWHKVRHDPNYDYRMITLGLNFMGYEIKGKVHNALCVWAFKFADLYVDATVEGVADGKIPQPLYDATVDVLCERFHICRSECARRLDDALMDLTGKEWDD